MSTNKTNSRKSSAKKENSSNLESRNSTPRLLNLYREKVIEELVKEFEYSNIMMVPKVTKVVINVGLGEALTNARALESATSDITIITGQKPVATKAKRSVARFKLREGQEIGVMTTLRGKRMYIFLDKLLGAEIIYCPEERDVKEFAEEIIEKRRI